MLAVTDFKLRFFGSALGYVWTLMRPLLLFGVLYVVFTEVVRLGGDIDHYPVYLLASIVMFTFFSETTSRGVTSLVERENLLRKVRFPRLVIPLSVALHALFNLGLNMIVVFVFVLASGIEPRLSWLELIPLLALLVVFATGVAMLVSALYVRYRDMQPIWEVVVQILFYASPVIYVASFYPDSVEERGDGQPAGGDLHAGAPRRDRPVRADRVRRGRRRAVAADVAGRGGRDVRPRALGVHARGAADRGGPVSAPEQERQQEAEALRARLDALEREHAEQIARAHDAVAAAQDRSYWLDRWNLDLNALMRRPGAAELRAAVRAVRAVIRLAKKVVRKATGREQL